tara:strand:- start:2035 stop:2628 length:594 start_codon:yes stop_codon:yes gene_type:complete
MKRTLKESVRDIRKMIGRIDHPTIVEAPGDEEGIGDEGDVGADEVEKGINIVNIPAARTYDFEKQVFSQLEDYQKTNNPSVTELFKTLNSKGIKSTNDFKSGELFSLMSKLGGGKSPFSLESNLGKDYKFKFKTKLGKNLVFKTDLKLKQKSSGIPNIADGFKFGGVNASLNLTIPNKDKAKTSKTKFNSKASGYKV